MKTYAEIFGKALGDLSLPLYSSAIREGFEGRDYGDMASPLEASIVALERTLQEEFQSWKEAREINLMALVEEISWGLDDGNLARSIRSLDKLQAILLDPGHIGYRLLTTDPAGIEKILRTRVEETLSYLVCLNGDSPVTVVEALVTTLQRETAYVLYEPRGGYRDLRVLANELWVTKPTAKALDNFLSCSQLLAKNERLTDLCLPYRKELLVIQEELELMELWQESTASDCTIRSKSVE